MPGLIEKGTSSISSGQAVSQVKLWADKINIDGPVSHLAYVRIERTGCSALVFFFLSPHNPGENRDVPEQSRM